MRELQDGLLYTDEMTKEQVIFNHYSFCELIKRIIVHYASKTFDEADKLVSKSFLSDVPDSYQDVTYITHEIEYHWAMLVVYGHMY